MTPPPPPPSAHPQPSPNLAPPPIRAWLHLCCLHPHRLSHSTTPRPPSVRQHTSPADSALLVADFLQALEPRRTACALVAAAADSTSTPSTSDSGALAGISTRGGLSLLARSATLRPDPRPRCRSPVIKNKQRTPPVWDFPIQNTRRRTQRTWAAHPHNEDTVTCAPHRGTPALPF